MKLKSIKIAHNSSDSIKVEINVRAYTDEKNKGLRGFADVAILENGKYTNGFNALQLVETTEGNLVIIEPKQKAYKDKEGAWKAQSFYVMKKAVKEDLVKHILANAQA